MTLAGIKDKIIYFTNLIYGINIPIHPIKVSNTRSKQIKKRTPGKSPQNSDTNPKNTKITDRLKIENIYEVDGYIEPIESSDTDIFFFPTEKTAYEVKRDLIKYVFNENTKLDMLCMVYEGEVIYGIMEKIDITEEAMDKTETTAPRYIVKLIFVSKINTIS